MNSGLYTAVTGGLTAMKRLDVLSNNLANVNTAGFKKDAIHFESILAEAAGVAGTNDSPGFVVEHYATDYSAGPVVKTGNTFDLALNGDGFFVVNTPEGKAYTRQGNFRIDATGKLVTADGREVLGAGAPIIVNGGNVSFDSEGKIFVEGLETGVIDIVDFPKPYALKKIGSSLFMPVEEGAAGVPVTNTVLIQGSLESSNVSAIEEMVRLIETTREYEACHKVIQSYDALTGRAVNDLGKV
ncbi:MAG: flagellar basal-body rod protein FlgF [Geobacteraceae bacterium]|nr:flagellar basal-body rod protein FlgF [Geobacteraceae bacterium]